MKVKDILKSSHQFSDQETHLVYQFRLLNYFMATGVVFGFLIGFLGSEGVMKIGVIQPIADYLFASFNLILIWYLRLNKKHFSLVAWLFVVSTLMLFLVALMSVETDEARVVWFYITVYVAYMLLGVRYGVLFTFLSIISITGVGLFIDLNISDTAIVTYVVSLTVLSLLARMHVMHIHEYENKLKNQSIVLEQSLEEIDVSLSTAESAAHVKSLFLANMSHEIRTPMNGVLSMILVLENTSLNEGQKSYLKSLKRSGISLLVLIDDLLDLSKIESGTFNLHNEAFCLYELLDDIKNETDSLFEDSKVVFEAHIDDKLPSALYSDARRLKQVIVNFISNAIKFSSGGKVELLIKGVCVGSNLKLNVEVKDNGIGIAKDKQKSVFEVFQQLSKNRIADKGIGLGLAISKKIISEMNGEINLVSEENKGSSFGFELMLPVVEKEVVKSVQSFDILKKKLKILVLEDDNISRLAIKTLLQSRGYKVEVVENGQQGIELLSNEEFDVLLIDLNMPILDGLETVRLIKQKKLSRAVVIGMTASVNQQEKEKCLKVGMNDLVEKPVDLDKLVKKINKLLG